ncbi:MAG: PAS domain S-box protein, partial [Chloroflexales bacterium]|nr:PAS domain S-box protein [Chloroflexales bacterium]
RSVDADLLRLIVDLAPEGILVATPAGHFCVVNPTAGALLGYDPPALRGHTWQDLIVGEARPTDLPPGPIQRQECRLRHQDGHELTVIISSRRLPDGRVLHMLHDLTARAQEEARLRASEARYRTLAEAAEDSIFLINPDETVQYVNPAGARFIALTPDTIVGRRYAEFFPPASAEAQRRHIQQVFATGLPHTDEFVVPTAQGDLWMSAALVPLTTPAGSIAGVLGTARDITARKRAEEALRLSEARFASIFHASPVGICLTRLADGTLIDLNEAFAQMMGYPRGQILGRTTTDLQLWANPTDRDGLVTLVQAQGRVANRELPFRRHSGALGRALASAELITVGAEQYLLCLLIDITAQKQAEDALRQSEARFRTVVTHAQPIIFLIDHDGTFLLSEGKMLAALGLRPGEVVGESAFVRYRDYPAILHGLRTALAGAHYEDTIDVGGVIFDIFYTPHRDADGVVLGAIGMAVDLTARTRAEAQARAQATRLAVLVDASRSRPAPPRPHRGGGCRRYR